ncbi:MAG TPA: glycosyltransferase [Chloroflexia bacterium]|nr:glycosyltransferase [Chloroflexia bacterium]
MQLKTQNSKLKTDSRTVSYLIGSYSTDLMGNGHHEEVIQAVRAQGVAVEVLTLVAQRGAPALEHQEIHGIPVWQINALAGRGPLAGLGRRASARLFHYEHFLSLVRALRRFYAQTPYSLIHAEAAYPFGAAAILAARGRALPVIVNIQGADVIALPAHDYGFRRFLLPRRLVGYTLRQAALVRVISPHLAGYVTALGADAGRVITVPRAIERLAYPPADQPLPAYRAAARATLLARYGLDATQEAGRGWVMFVGRLHPFKGLEYLVEALPALNAALAAQGAAGGPRLWLCGPARDTEHYGDFAAHLRRRAASLGVADQLTFTGQLPRPEVREHLAAADVVCIPSVVEAMNRVTLEATVVGTPVVVSESTGIAAYLAPLGACVAVPPQSPAALAEAIGRLLHDPAYHAQVAAAALQAARGFATDRVAAEMLRLYARVGAGG